MNKVAKEIVDKGINKQKTDRYFSSASILMPNNTKPKESTLWHMHHKPYQY